MTKRISLYGIFCVLALIFGYIEHLISFDFIAPGIKLGLSNAIVLFFIAKGDIRGAFLVNFARIILSAFLFSAPSTLIYSVPAGIISVIVMSLVIKLLSLSLIGVSILGALAHNITQVFIASFMLSSAVFAYLPWLLLSALVTGFFIGFIVKILDKKLSKLF